MTLAEKPKLTIFLSLNVMNILIYANLFALLLLIFKIVDIKDSRVGFDCPLIKF